MNNKRESCNDPLLRHYTDLTLIYCDCKKNIFRLSVYKGHISGQKFQSHFLKAFSNIEKITNHLFQKIITV